MMAGACDGRQGGRGWRWWLGSGRAMWWCEEVIMVWARSLTSSSMVCSPAKLLDVWRSPSPTMQPTGEAVAVDFVYATRRSNLGTRRRIFVGETHTPPWRQQQCTHHCAGWGLNSVKKCWNTGRTLSQMLRKTAVHTICSCLFTAALAARPVSCFIWARACSGDRSWGLNLQPQTHSSRHQTSGYSLLTPPNPH